MFGKKAKKAKLRYNSKGWPLFDAAEAEIPTFLAQALTFLHTKGLEVEGLFRISALLTDVEKLSKQWKKGKLPDLENQDVHTVACTVKQYFREFDDPLLTFELYDAFVEAARQSSNERKDEYLRQATALLPPGNRAVLRALLGLLVQVAKYSNINKMTVANLAIVFAPSIVREQTETPTSALLSMRVCAELVEYLIGSFERLNDAVAASAAAATAATLQGTVITHVTAPPAANEEEFVRVLRRGTMRLGTRMLMEKLEEEPDETLSPPMMAPPPLPEISAGADWALEDVPPTMATPPPPSLSLPRTAASPQPQAAPELPELPPAPMLTVPAGVAVAAAAGDSEARMRSKGAPPQPPGRTSAAEPDPMSTIGRGRGRGRGVFEGSGSPVKGLARTSGADATAASVAPVDAVGLGRDSVEMESPASIAPSAPTPAPAGPRPVKEAAKVPLKMLDFSASKVLAKGGGGGGAGAGAKPPVSPRDPAAGGVLSAVPPRLEGEGGNGGGVGSGGGGGGGTGPIKAKGPRAPSMPMPAVTLAKSPRSSLSDMRQAIEGIPMRAPGDLTKAPSKSPPPQPPLTTPPPDDVSHVKGAKGADAAKGAAARPVPLQVPSASPVQPSGALSPGAVPPKKAGSAKGPPPLVKDAHPKDGGATIRHSTTKKEDRATVEAKLGAIMMGGATAPRVPGARASVVPRKTVNELLSMMAAGNLTAVNEYLNTLGRAERDEVRGQLAQMRDSIN